MRFRPCIDIHNGSVKQIVGGSLSDVGNQAEQNFISDKDAAFYGEMYQRDGLSGGHIIILNPSSSPYYEKDLEQAKRAMDAFPGGLQIGGGVTNENAEMYLRLGASHVIVTSYVFRDGQIDYPRLEQLSGQIGKEKLVLDLSCRKYQDGYHIVTDRWQKMTEERLDGKLISRLSKYCDEFLVHAVDVEGQISGIERDVLSILSCNMNLPVTYAGGVHSMQDILYINEVGNGKIDFTVGSALDLFGGSIPYRNLLDFKG